MFKKTMLGLFGSGVLALGLVFAGPAGTALAFTTVPSPVGDWNFQSGSTADTTGNWSNFDLYGDAQVNAGTGLQVDGTGNGDNAATGWGDAYGYSGPALDSKTLVSWVRLDNTSITSGSPLSLYEPLGGADVFDAIDYGEQQSYQWMAGSEGFRRTQQFAPGYVDNNGPDFTRQIAISYQDNGDGSETITGCLNGTQLGSYVTGNSPTFTSGDSPEALFGPRHRDSANGGAPRGSINAHILESQVYDQAMTCAQIAALSDSTSTAVTCTPGSVSAYGSTTCTATVTDTAASPTNPTGTVTFASGHNAHSSFTGNPCTLTPVAMSTTQSQCSETFNAGVASDTVTGTYNGNTSYLASSGQSSTIKVTPHATKTTLRCNPSTVVVNNTSTCTITVANKDGASANPAAPTGSVTVSGNKTDQFPNGASCSLSAVDNQSSSCTVTYQPTTGPNSHALSAHYGGDTAHTGSTGTTTVTVKHS